VTQAAYRSFLAAAQQVSRLRLILIVSAGFPLVASRDESPPLLVRQHPAGLDHSPPIHRQAQVRSRPSFGGLPAARATTTLEIPSTVERAG
jgi:hypothetical protein